MADKDWKKDFDPKAVTEARKAELDGMMAKLEQGVQDVFASDDYKKLLNVMAQMPHYSVNNQILIMLQNPQATMCNSFTGWKKQNRFVKAGEKGLRILAPAPYQMEKEQEKVDADGKVILDKDGEPVKETVKVTINAFKPVSTFDISQTDGEPLPQLGVAELAGNVEGYGTLLEAIKDASPVPITFENIESGARGYYHLEDHRIAIQEGMSELQTIKTALHEIAHAKYHSIEAMDQSGEKKSKQQKECEAESIAFVCSAHYGLDTGAYSYSYLAGWSSGKETPELKASLQTIKQGASEIIDALDERIRALTYDRVEANRAPEGFISVIEGVNIPEDELPFVSAEANQPAGFIKIEPPVNVEDFKSEKMITLSVEEPKEKETKPEKVETGEKKSTPKAERTEKKPSVTKKLDAKKKEAAKMAKPKENAKNKDLQEAI
jgi:hypothetical protein